MKKQKIIEKLKALIEELEAPETFESIVKDAKKTGVKRPPQKKSKTLDWVQIIPKEFPVETEKAACFQLPYYRSKTSEWPEVTAVWFPKSVYKEIPRYKAIELFGFDPLSPNHDLPHHEVCFFIPKWLADAKVEELKTKMDIYNLSFYELFEEMAINKNKLDQVINAFEVLL